MNKAFWLVAISLLFLVACGGGGAKTINHNVTITTTLGEELVDLEEARRRGIITNKEYLDQKQALLRNNKRLSRSKSD